VQVCCDGAPLKCGIAVPFAVEVSLSLDVACEDIERERFCTGWWVVVLCHIESVADAYGGGHLGPGLGPGCGCCCSAPCCTLCCVLGRLNRHWQATKGGCMVQADLL
jgi:hypothetical protein